jgi:hypothetical protein
MIYWSWGTGRKRALVASMVGLSATTLLILGWSLERSLLAWRTLLIGISVLTIPQIVAFLLFVGLRTGMMPQRGRRVSRTEHPIDFWMTAGGYGIVLAMYIFFGLGVAMG